MDSELSGTEPLRVGVVGCGNISHAYIENMQASSYLEVVACGDQPPDRALECARRHGIARAGTTADVLADSDVQLIVNLTVPALHFDINLGALRAGKHVWSEKPLTVSRAEGSSSCARRPSAVWRSAALRTPSLERASRPAGAWSTAG
ncbi:Gfo/Idh/MocA family oxidoreductase [Candidatus Nephthysia bennettiae]|uniref:Gfo/Idh/MocA family protein n=1 Tax=Candidatus Nephthysia bennettiae TaxID=3127016 RepID=UPI0030C6DCAC